jgi:hypothetical protein
MASRCVRVAKILDPDHRSGRNHLERLDATLRYLWPEGPGEPGPGFWVYRLRPSQGATPLRLREKHPARRVGGAEGASAGEALRNHESQCPFIRRNGGWKSARVTLERVSQVESWAKLPWSVGPQTRLYPHSRFGKCPNFRVWKPTLAILHGQHQSFPLIKTINRKYCY